MTQGSNPPTAFHPGVRSFVANGVRCFPTELLYEVITLTLSRYLSDVLIAPTSTRSWDAIGALLHVDYHFRCCTLTVLDALWDGTFMDRKSGHPRNYTHKIEYLRRLAELARSNPRDVLPPERHVLSMRRNTAPYERLGRHFVVYLARVNACLTDHGHCVCRVCHERSSVHEMSNLALDFAALPKGLRNRMFGEFADYVVSDLLVWVRAIEFRELVSEAAASVTVDSGFSEVNVLAYYLDDARQCMQMVRQIAESLGRDDGGECAVLSRDAVSKDSFVTLLAEMGRLQELGGSRKVNCDGWKSVLGVLLTSKEREVFGITSPD